MGVIAVAGEFGTSETLFSTSTDSARDMAMLITITGHKNLIK